MLNTAIRRVSRVYRKNALELLEDVASGRMDMEAALEKLRNLPYEDIGFAKLDHHRELRRDFPEVVFGQGGAKSVLSSTTP